jgi:hypothetical protein
MTEEDKRLDRMLEMLEALTRAKISEVIEKELDERKKEEIV